MESAFLLSPAEREMGQGSKFIENRGLADGGGMEFLSFT